MCCRHFRDSGQGIVERLSGRLQNYSNTGRGPKGNKYKIDYQKLLNLYPNFNDTNQKLYAKIVNSKAQKKKKRRSRAEQRKIFQELLAPGKVKNQAEIARKFDVSRVWVSKVLS